MKPLMLLFVVSAGIASPALAQSRLYTNADLGRPLNQTRTPTAEEMQGVIARQFTMSPKAEEAKVFVLPRDPSWPFTYSLRLEPDPWRLPSGLPFYRAWPFYGGYVSNPFVIYPGSYSFDCCHTKPHVRDASHGAVDRRVSRQRQ
jgi:hypothetical protein